GLGRRRPVHELWQRVVREGRRRRVEVARVASPRVHDFRRAPGPEGPGLQPRTVLVARATAVLVGRSHNCTRSAGPSGPATPCYDRAMGVVLTPIIEKQAITLDALRGQTLAVDGNGELYQFLALIRLRDGTPLQDSKGRTTSHLSGLFYRTTRLI